MFLFCLHECMPSSFLQVRPVAEDEMFKVVRTGKRKSKYHIYWSKLNYQFLMSFFLPYWYHLVKMV